LCVYDFTYKCIIPEYFVFKTAESNYEVVENYFYGMERGDADLDMSFAGGSQVEEERRIHAGLLVERNLHVCHNQEFTDVFS